jgi:hypothetical protein
VRPGKGGPVRPGKAGPVRSAKSAPLDGQSWPRFTGTAGAAGEAAPVSPVISLFQTGCLREKGDWLPGTGPPYRPVTDPYPAGVSL